MFQRLLQITVESEYKIKTQWNCNNINNKRGEVHAYISTNQNNNTSNKNNTKIRIDENNTQKIRIDKNNIFFDSLDLVHLTCQSVGSAYEDLSPVVTRMFCTPESHDQGNTHTHTHTHSLPHSSLEDGWMQV